MRILSLDPSLSTGWSCWTQDNITSGIQQFPIRRGESPGTRFIKFRIWLTEMLRTFKPTILAYEMPGHFKSAAAAASMNGFIAIMHLVCTDLSVDVMPVSPSALKYYCTFKGNAGKPLMVEAAKKRWPHYTGEGDKKGDQADALCIMDWVLNELKITRRYYTLSKKVG